MKKIVKFILYPLAALVAYPFVLLSVQGISQEILSPKINNRLQLEQILETEKRRAGIKQSIEISIKLLDREEAYAKKVSEGKYEIGLPQVSNVSLLRHELYHISDGHCDTKFNVLKYLFIQEPQVTIYQTTGLKL